MNTCTPGVQVVDELGRLIIDLMCEVMRNPGFTRTVTINKPSQ